MFYNLLLWAKFHWKKIFGIFFFFNFFFLNFRQNQNDAKRKGYTPLLHAP